MRIYQGLEFKKWSSKYGISDEMLIRSIEEMNQGSFEANLGGNVYKKHMVLGNKGKSGGVRTILAFKLNDRAFFIYGFAKSKMDNIGDEELKALKKLAKIYLNFTESEIEKAIQKGHLFSMEKKNG